MHLGCWLAAASAQRCGHLQGLQGRQVESLRSKAGARKKRGEEELRDEGIEGGKGRWSGKRKSHRPKQGWSQWDLRWEEYGERRGKPLLLSPGSRRRYGAAMRWWETINKRRAKEGQREYMRAEEGGGAEQRASSASSHWQLRGETHRLTTTVKFARNELHLSPRHL